MSEQQRDKKEFAILTRGRAVGCSTSEPSSSTNKPKAGNHKPPKRAVLPEVERVADVFEGA